MRTLSLSLQRDKAYPISRQLYGAFLEDINFACDGGLNANKVANYSFDGQYYDKKTGRALSDPLRYWTLQGGEMESQTAGQLDGNSRFLSFYVSERAVLTNLGYNGHGQYAGKPVMSVAEGESYDFSCYIRGNYEGLCRAYVAAEDDSPLTDVFEFEAETAWRKVSTVLTGLRTDYGKLVFEFEGKGYLDLDLVIFMTSRYWGCQDPKWTAGRLRPDLVEALRRLSPSFLRFPGGRLVNGRNPGNAYNWKNTVGPLSGRRSDFNLWGETMEDGGYGQSCQIGFYEYFCLCEDIGAEPLPVLNAGLYGKNGKAYGLSPSDPLFESTVISSYLDLIDFCNGKKGSSYWADLRCEMGHPEPFGLSMIGVGNENGGRGYRKRFEKIEEAVHKKQPGIRLVCSAGRCAGGLTKLFQWRFSKKINAGGWVDEHIFRTPGWFIRSSRHYDRYERGSSKVFIGEYAANKHALGRRYAAEQANPYESALAEAAFLTGLERNADVVEMASYAPLFNMVGGVNQAHSLVEFNPYCHMMTANYKVQELFACHVGDNGVPVKGRLPKRLFASCTYDGTNFYLKLVNTGRARYGLTLPYEVGSQTVLHAELSARNLLTFRTDPVHSVDFTEGLLNPPRDEFDGSPVLRDPDAPVQTLALIKPHSVNLFVIPEKKKA